MSKSPALRRWLSVGGTVAVLAAVLAVIACQKSVTDEAAAREAAQQDQAARAWPLFGGSVSRNLVNLVEKDIPTDWDVTADKQKNIKWAADLGSKAYGGPIVAGGKIFIGTNNNKPRNPAVTGDKGILMCFRESDGSFLWQAIHDKLEKGRVNDWPEEGICSSPVVEGDRLYYVSNRCEVVCASTGGLAAGNQGVTDEKYKGKTDADVIWRLDMIGAFNVFPHNLATCSPLIAGDTLFVITSNGVDKDHITIPSPQAPSFLAISKKDGKPLWKSNLPGDKIMHGQWSNPVYAEANGKAQIIFPGGDGLIYSFNPKDGSLLWKFDCNPKSSVYKLGGEGTRSDFVSTPVVHDNKLYIGVGQDPEHKKGIGHLWCIDIAKEPKNAAKDLSPVNDNFDPKAPVNKDSGLVWHYGGQAGENSDRDYVFGRTLSTCAVHDGLCYAGEFEGILHCLDAKTGKQYWEHDMGADNWSSPYWVDGHVYIGNEKGTICVFKHGKEKQLVREIDMFKGQRIKSGKVRATPVAVNGTLYVITENPCRLWAITKK
ncbi:MAG TPA: PQQ-binding-like beta-propeller repeat protein [Gemmataceae bacterium]|jgi:outer membrane protein assembly factor BamB|nr:PQQ-binding-like beta-propeller repeat protein [Gemmataceae bacterium]